VEHVGEGMASRYQELDGPDQLAFAFARFAGPKKFFK
jgi:hypothetical protein